MKHNTGMISVGLFILLGACSSGPKAPEKGTPAFYWQAAKETQTAGELGKTNDHLSKLLKGENEFTAKAQVWKLVLVSGMAKGYMEMADAFENGARANKTNQMSFRRTANDLRNAANALSLEVAEVYAKYQQKNKDTEVVLAYPFPSTSPAMVSQWGRATVGQVLTPDEIETGIKNSVKRSVMMATCSAVSAKDDVAKTSEMFKVGEVKVPRAAFVTYMASALYDESQLYSEMKLNIPERMKIFLSKAEEAVKSVPESKETKDLSLRIEAATEKLKKK